MKKKSLLLGALLLGLSVTSAAEVRTINEKGVNVGVEKIMDLPGLPQGISENYVVGRTDGLVAYRTSIETGNTEYYYINPEITTFANSVNNRGLAGISITVVDNNTLITKSHPALWNPDGSVEVLDEVVEVAERHLIDAGNPSYSTFVHVIAGVNNSGDIAGYTRIDSGFEEQGVVAWRLNKNKEVEILDTPEYRGGFVTGITESGLVSGYVIWGSNSMDTLPVTWDRDGNMQLSVGFGTGKVFAADNNKAIGQLRTEYDGFEQGTIFDLKTGTGTQIFEGIKGSDARAFDSAGNIFGSTFIAEDDWWNAKPTFLLLRSKFGTTHDITSLIVEKSGLDYPVPGAVFANNNLFTAGYHETIIDQDGIEERYGLYNLILE